MRLCLHEVGRENYSRKYLLRFSSLTYSNNRLYSFGTRTGPWTLWSARRRKSGSSGDVAAWLWMMLWARLA